MDIKTILESTIVATKHKTSIEQLHHFQCHNCTKWWSIGDLPTEIKHLYCPWCGQYGGIK